MIYFLFVRSLIFLISFCISFTFAFFTTDLMETIFVIIIIVKG